MVPRGGWPFGKEAQKEEEKNYLFKVFISDQQDAAHKCLVVVQGVKMGGSQVEGALLWVDVMEVRVHRKQVNIVHGHMVTLSFGFQVPHVD